MLPRLDQRAQRFSTQWSRRGEALFKRLDSIDPLRTFVIDAYWSLLFSFVLIQSRQPVHAQAALVFAVASYAALALARWFPRLGYVVIIVLQLWAAATGATPNLGIGAFVVAGARLKTFAPIGRAVGEKGAYHLWYFVGSFALGDIPTVVHWRSSVLFAVRPSHASAPDALILFLASIIRANWNIAEMLFTRAERRSEEALAEERSRIARELHDVVAHQMSVVTLQAQGADAILDRDPTAAHTALDTITRTSRDALVELRRLLGVLRAPIADAHGGHEQPGIGDLGSLVATSRAAGVEVTLDVDRLDHDVAPGVALSAYRIIQEALTNVAKHAPGATADVRVRSRPGELAIEVVNGPAARRKARAAGSQVGLIGMRERADLLGGSLTAGPFEGGWAVVARLPLAPRPVS